MRRRLLGTTTMAALLLAGCNPVGPDFTRPDAPSALSWLTGKGRPATPAKSVPIEQPVDPNWWTLFNDPVLTSLEQRVAAGNLDLKASEFRLAESRAQLGVAQALQFPLSHANSSYTHTKASNNGQFAVAPDALGASGASGSTAGGVAGTHRLNPFDVFQVGFDASWELDLWGGVRRSVESASALVEASAEARRTILLSTMAEVARDYIALRGVQTQLRIARDNVRTARQSLNLTQQRAAGGVTTDLDVANASAQLRNTAAQIPRLEQQEAAGINALSLLLGQPPNALRDELAAAKPVPPVPPKVPVGIPSELARRRPDIREAEARLHAATADIGVAIADFYPSVKISGSIGLQSIQFTRLFDLNSHTYAGGPGISIPLFEGGKLKATLHFREAAQQEAAINYQKIVLNAWHEVDNALTAYATEQARREQLRLAEADNRRAVGFAQSRYQQGVADFLAVLDAERNLLATQLQLADSTTAISSNLVALYKALGGGWETSFPEEEKIAGR
jgi:NodT family efflux transporter outer membrane factor (OMF) lipoprotein